jgi:dihydroxy-acid dehydratase
MVGGPIALVKDNDEILIDIPNRKLDVVLPESELDKRRKKWSPPTPVVTEGYLARYASAVSSADKGAVLI